ncbi:hypothetical protein U0070_026056 [Myodes glareolus]|uniref:Uncharacterized protein n=1 Tax=Myodes glareolus TaxID=447135 RepID=A0AAW0HXU7_MYOGA
MQKFDNKEATLFAASPISPMSCSSSGTHPEAASACAASVTGLAPLLLALATLPTSTAAESKASPAGKAREGPGAEAATKGTDSIAVQAGEPAERCGPALVAAGGTTSPEGAMSNGVYALPSAANGKVKPVVSSTPLMDFLMQLEDPYDPRCSNWTGEFDAVMEQLRVIIVTMNSTRVDAGMTEGLSSRISTAIKHLKEWVSDWSDTLRVGDA